MRPTLAPVFFTQNGHEIGTVLMEIPFKGFYPAVGLHSEGEEVSFARNISFEETMTMMVIGLNHLEPNTNALS